MNRKKILTSLIIFVGALFLLIPNNVQAANQKLNLGVTKERTQTVINDKYPKYKYQYQSEDDKTINVWKIVNYERPGAVEGQNNYSSKNLIYCLRAGLGFEGAFKNEIDYSTKAIEYSQKFDLKDPNVLATIRSIYRDTDIDTSVFDSNSEKYKALLWLIDKAYIPGESTEADRKELLESVMYKDPNTGLEKSIYYWMYEKTPETTNDDITDSDIDMVWQLAIWYFTNSDEAAYNNKELKTIKLKYSYDGQAETEYKTYNEIFSLITAEDKKDYGEWRFNYLNALYKYLIQTAETKGKEGYEGDGKTYATVYLPNENAQDNQPVVLITRKQQPIDLSIRQFVTAINDQKVETRIPDVNTQKLKSAIDTTAIYNHKKEALSVEEGDVITYTIRIYNEGEIDAKALQIREYLPAGLIYEKANAEDLSWTIPENYEGTRLYETTNFCTIKNVGGNIEKFYKLNGITKENLETMLLKDAIIPAYEEDVLSYIDIEIKCKVDTSTETSLVNIVEISNEISADGKIKVDIDSVPNGNLTIPNDENISKYTGGKDGVPCYDGTNVVVEEGKTYYPGQQDDDDYEKIAVKPKELDLALKKFISEVNGKKSEPSREPEVDLSKLKTGESSDATYKTIKEALAIEYQNVITYTLRVYNEGGISGYAAEITDNIPEGLEFITDSEVNKKYGWKMLDKDEKETEKLEEAKYLITNYLSKENTAVDNLIKAYNKGDEIDYKDVQIQFKVTSNAAGKPLINIAQISKETDEQGKEIKKDRDSTPSRKDPYNYDDATKNEDDIDIELVKIKQFDLALKKFITEVNGTKLAKRAPTVDTKKLASGESTDAEYTMLKTPVEVESGYIITYTIRVYNEGSISGYVREIVDNIPEGLEYIANSTINQKYGWFMLDKNKGFTDKPEEAVYLATNYLADISEETKGSNLIKAYDGGETLDYKDVQIQFKVTYKVTKEAERGKQLINIAQIASAISENGNEEIKDRDSKPNYDDPYNFKDKTKNEDDIDYEDVVVRYFDLTLKKFVSAINGTPVNNRAPEVKYEDEKIKYTMKTEPVDVTKGDTIYYTIRVYNEGDLAGYAYEITDNIPEGLQFLVDDEINKKYGWKMLDKEGKEVENLQDAEYLTTEYLKDTKLTGFDKSKETSENNPSYADVQIAFKVTFESKTKEDKARTLINIAQISRDSHDDIDSDPKRDDVYNFDDNSKNEDDIDYEKVKVRYFDLSLLKWVSKAIVTVNGQTEEKETGNSGLPTDIMPKVEIKSKEINKVKVKFEYVIKVTNEGQIPGYALEVKDYIPEGLKFEQEDNPDWYEVEGEANTIATDKIALELLQPGDSREVKVVLTWINGTENFGEKINFAEISKDYNDSETPDADSTPNNKVKEEDDMDSSSVILSVKTGQGRIYYMLGATIILTISAGIIIIKKYVL